MCESGVMKNRDLARLVLAVLDSRQLINGEKMHCVPELPESPFSR